MERFCTRCLNEQTRAAQEHTWVSAIRSHMDRLAISSRLARYDIRGETATDFRRLLRALISMSADQSSHRSTPVLLNF